jgi:hypothetical protein
MKDRPSIFDATPDSRRMPQDDFKDRISGRLGHPPNRRE